MADEQLVIRDPRTLRALAHPARLTIMKHLGDSGPATATECAEICGLTPSATSYHLRMLARAGLVEEAPNRGDGRERLWQAPSGSIQVEVGPDASAEEMAAARRLVDVFLARDDSAAREWIERSRDESKEWHAASALFSTHLVLTADELERLTAQVTKLADRYRRSRRTKVPEGARVVVVSYRAFPVD